MRRTFGWVAAAGLILVASSAAWAGDKYAFSKNKREMAMETKIPAPDGKHELANYVYRDSDCKCPAGFDLLEERGLNRDLQIDGSGTHSGLAVQIFSNGDTLFQRYEGTHKTTPKADGSWEVNYEGVSQYEGGTGRFAKAKGKGRYKGHVTPDTFREDNEIELNK